MPKNYVSNRTLSEVLESNETIETNLDALCVL